MKGRVALVSLLGVCLSGPGLARAEANAAEAAAAPRATSAPATGAMTASAPEDLAGLIAAIRNAGDPDTATDHYAKARKIGRDNPEVYDAYMKKMLQFGRPRTAQFPAIELTRLAAKNGTAWGVLGYNAARRGKYLQAFTSTLRGMEVLPTDPGIQHNAGALMAWQETQGGVQNLPKALQALVAQQAPKWAKKKEYAAGHRKGKAVFSAWMSRVKALEDDAASAAQAVASAAKASDWAAAKYRDGRRQIARLESDVAAMSRTVRNLELQGRKGTEREAQTREKKISALRHRINQTDLKVRSLKGSQGRLRKEAAEKASVLKKAKADLSKAKSLLSTEQKKVPSLAWLPPAVDGVVTPEVVSQGRAEAPPKADAAPNGESDMEGRLKMARLLLRNNRRPQAARILQEIIQRHPDSRQAEEARKLLKQHELGDVPPP